MLEKKTLDIEIGARLKEKLRERAVASGLNNPIPGILWGKWDDEAKEHYSIGFYERAELPVNDPIRIIVADGIEFLITQDWICDELEDKKMDLVDGELKILER